jgi:hypothetical protein
MIYGHSASQALFRMEYDPVLRFLSYSISQKLSGFRLKSTAGMTECGDSLKSNIDEFVKRYTRNAVRLQSRVKLTHYSGSNPGNEACPEMAQIVLIPSCVQVSTKGS